MPKVTIYHNPRCSKSRETLRLLEAHHLEPQVIEYLQTPPSASTLKTLLKQLGLNARELMRQKESVYKEEKLNNPSLTEEQLIAAMIQHPILIERPIVVVDQKAVIGRPPENVLELIK